MDEETRQRLLDRIRQSQYTPAEVIAQAMSNPTIRAKGTKKTAASPTKPARKPRAKKVKTAKITREKAKRNVVVNVTQDDWRTATQEWQNLLNQGYYQQGYYQIKYENLFDFQKNLWVKAKKDPKSLAGEPVLIIADYDGNILGRVPYPATILKVYEVDGAMIYKCIFHPIEEERWDGERIEEIRAFQILPLRKPEPATTNEISELQAKENELKMLSVLQTINNNRNREITNLKKQEQDALRYIQDYNQSIMNYEKQIGQIHQKLKNAVTDDITLDDLKSNLDELATHKKIDWAMITTNGNFIFQTKMLYYTERDTGKERQNTPIGRFAVCALTNSIGIVACNMDYMSHGRGHMNMSGGNGGISLCLGGNSKNVLDMIRSGRFYDLADFMVLFFSIFPHDAGDGGYTKADEWVPDRQNLSQNNPWANHEALYKITQKEGIADKKTRKKSKAKKGLPGLAEKLQKLGKEEKFIQPTKATKIRTVSEVNTGNLPETQSTYNICDNCGLQNESVQRWACYGCDINYMHCDNCADEHEADCDN